MTAAARSRGFSLLELVVVIVLMSVLISIAIERLIFLQVRAERLVMEQTLGAMRSGLHIALAELAAKNRIPEIASLAGSNPMLRLAERPFNYRGELYGPDPAVIPPGSWYFDTRERVLVYIVDNADAFTSALPPPRRARFSVELVFDDVNADSRYDAKVDRLRGVQLQPKESYAWVDGVTWLSWPWDPPARATSAPTR